MSNDTNNCEDSPYPKDYADDDDDGLADGWTFRYSDCDEDSFNL